MSSNNDEGKIAEKQYASKHEAPSKYIEYATQKMDNIDNMVDKQQINDYQHAPNVDDENKDKEESDHKPEVFEFGELFEYWNKELRANMYIEPKVQTLTGEVINIENGEHHNLIEYLWNTYFDKAQKLHVGYANQ